MSKAETITIIRGTVIEVGGAENGPVMVRLARNAPKPDLIISGLTEDEARDIASSHFMGVVSVTIKRSDK